MSGSEPSITKHGTWSKLYPAIRIVRYLCFVKGLFFVYDSVKTKFSNQVETYTIRAAQLVLSNIIWLWMAGGMAQVASWLEKHEWGFEEEFCVDVSVPRLAAAWLEYVGRCDIDPDNVSSLPRFLLFQTQVSEANVR